MNKIIKLLLVFLVVIVFLEIIFLIAYEKYIPKKYYKEIYKDKLISENQVTSEDQAISEKTLKKLIELQVFKKGVLKNLKLIYELQGEIIDFSYLKEGNRIEDELFGIVIKGNYGYVNTLFFSKKTLQSMRIVEKNKNQIKTIDFKQLKKGDFIKINLTTNLLKLDETNDILDSLENFYIEKYN